MTSFRRLFKKRVAEGPDILVDRKEGLMWQRKHHPAKMSYDEALAYCQSLRLGSFSDWLLPSLDQFRRLRHSGKLLRAISPADGVFWTSSASDYGTATQAYASNGRCLNKTEKLYVRAVRRL